MENTQNVRQRLSDFRNALSFHSKEYLYERYVRRATDDFYDVVNLLRSSIAQEQKNGCYLFSGLRGSGKTTELRRLVSELETQDNIHAYYCDASDYQNLNDPEFGPVNIIMTALAGFSAAIRKKYPGNSLLLEKEKSFLGKISGVFQKIANTPVTGVNVGGYGLELGVTLGAMKDNPGFGKKLAEFAEKSNELYDEAIEYAEKLVEVVRQNGTDSKIVLAVDSMERLSASIGKEDTLRKSLQDTFFDNIALLRKFPFTVIYSIPPYTHAMLPGVRAGVTDYMALSNFKVMDENFEKNREGIDQMVQIVSCHYADWQEILEREVLEELAYQSGGNVRLFFQLLHKIALFADIDSKQGGEFPIRTIEYKVVDRALKSISDDWQFLDKNDVKWLTHIRNQPGDFSREIDCEDSPFIIRLFNQGLILNYQNGHPWYQVSPLLKDYLGL